jgi:hypothetical protein
MKWRLQHFALLVPFLLTGCPFQKKQTQPLQALAPATSTAPKPEPEHPALPPGDTTIPTQPVKAAADENLPEKPVARHRRPASKQAQTTAQVATAPPGAPPAETPALSAIGQLSTGEPSDLRNSVLEVIASTEHGLANIGRALNDQEQKTAAQIREFLKQSKEALAADDVVGARTLAQKAKVLLSELSQ